MEKTERSPAKIILNLILISNLFLALKAQPTFRWADNFGGSQNDRGRAICTDAYGNVYTVGQFLSTVDLDPGPGVFTVTSQGGNDIFISKVNAAGNFIWAKAIGGLSTDMAMGVALDGTGNVIVTGNFQSNVDFDPGPSTFNLSSAGSNDIFILKLSPTGNFVWAKDLGGSLDDIGFSITADASGNVFTTGYFTGVADFDPSGGTFTMSAQGANPDVFISKLDASGNFVWAKQFAPISGSAQIFGNAIKLDGTGNVIIGGSFTNGAIVDFDPGPGTYTLTGLNMDIFIAKLDGSGNFIWADGMGGVGGSNTAKGIAIDASNNIYATGYTDSNTDFDPGPGTFTIPSMGGGTDIFVLKLNASGNFVWATKMGGSSGDSGDAIDVDAAGNVYSTGYYDVSADFDPGPGTFSLTTIGGRGVFISKLNNSGNFVSAVGFGFSNSEGTGLDLDPWFDICTTGYFDQTTDFDPGAGTYTLVPNGGGGSEDIFVHKLGQSICPTFSLNSSTSSFTLMCALNSLTLNAVNTSTIGGVTYTWTAPSLTTSNGNSYTCTVAGIYTISASAISNTCTVTQTLSVIQTSGNVNYSVTTVGSTCNNNGTASVSIISGTSPYTYTWSTGSNTSNVSGVAPGNYTVTVGDANLCTTTKTFVLNNDASPFSSAPICFVSVDSLSQNNVITWDKTVFPTADSFMVYRETATNVYSKIQAQPYTAFSRFVDTVKTLYFPNTGNPNVGTYRYKLKTKDNCGNYSDFSPYHNTLFTTNNNGTFTWMQLYTIESATNPVGAYILERDNLSNGNWAAVGSVAGTQNFIIDPNYNSYINTASWRVRTQWSIICIPSKMSSQVFTTSYSNRVTNNPIGLRENVSANGHLYVYPNPASGILNVEVEKLNEIVQFQLFNSIGELVLNEKITTQHSTFNIQNLPSGIYFVKVGTLTKKIIKE